MGVVVVLDPEEHGSRDLHQGVVGCLLLLPARVAVVEVVDFVSYLWKGSGHGITDQLKVLAREEEKQSPWQGWQQGLGWLPVPWGCLQRGSVTAEHSAVAQADPAVGALHEQSWPKDSTSSP